MKKYLVAILALTVALAIAPSALADPYIVGSIGVTGGNDHWNATDLYVPGTTGVVADDGGSFVGIVPVNPASGSGATINFSDLTFSSPDILVFTTDTGVATFTITGPVSITEDTGTNLQIAGTGILTLTGYAPTLANFNSDSTDSNNSYGSGSGASSTFGIDITSLGEQPPVIPEPGTLSLFGTGLLGLAGMLRSKFGKAR